MDMKSKTKKDYETPQLTVVSFKMERGYASSTTYEFDQFIFWNSPSENQMENYSTGNGWDQGSNHFWE